MEAKKQDELENKQWKKEREERNIKETLKAEEKEHKAAARNKLTMEKEVERGKKGRSTSSEKEWRKIS